MNPTPCFCRLSKDDPWKGGRLLAWSIDFQELRDGVGQYPVAIVEFDDTGDVCLVPPCCVRFKNPE